MENLDAFYKIPSAPHSRGRLKIFFGYAAGVGKTYAMLEAAHQAKNQGIDVVVGYIERHTRPDTCLSGPASMCIRQSMSSIWNL